MQQGIIEGFGLSPQQKRLWLLQQTDQSQVYRAQCAVLIEGKLQPEILKEALERVVNKHEILRTGFRCLPGMTIPVQFISANNASWRIVDLSSLDDKAQAAEIDELFQEEGRVAFDFDEGSITRTSLIVLCPDKHVLVVTLPALCADARMLNNLMGEIARFYAACLRDEELFEEPMQYADFFSWAEELIEADGAETGKEYWRTRDLSALGGLRVPFEIQPAGKPTFEPKVISIPIGSDTLAKVEAFVSKYGGSASIFLQACWQVLLWRFTGQAEMIIGTAYDGRKYEELEEALGLYARYLPVECHLEESLQFSELFKQVRETASSVYKWQEYFAWDQARGLTAENGKELFFPLCFEYEHQPPKLPAADVSFSIYKQYACIDRYKVKLSCIGGDGSLTAEFHYDPALFRAEDIQHLAGNFHTLLGSVITNPEAAISKFNILDDSERQRLLCEFNDTKADYLKNKCIHELIEEQVARTPEAIAVICEGEQLTYAELNERANQLAHYLRKLGVGPEVRVGICVERSLEMVVGILGIVKAGGAYVPLDPAYPRERLTFMLEDAQVPVLLTQQRLIRSLPEQRAQVVSLDTDWPLISQQPEENLKGSAAAENLAYVIYTSGSTGKPKGVMITHANLCHYVQSIRLPLGITGDDTYLHTASIAFSSSVRQLMVPLTQGATVVIATSTQIGEPLALFEMIKQQGVTIIDLVPSYWRNCTEALASLEPLVRQTLLNNNLRLILSASEPLLSDVPRKWAFEFKHGARFINMFGQTETTGIVSIYPISAWNEDEVKVVPIGKPIANSQIYILDNHLQPVPMGVAGELYIGGLGLGRGYHNQPELTAEKFVSNPLGRLGNHLYKTGDLGRYLPDGTVEFLGRKDHQVKIRGFRIELGEIEAVLGQHPAVSDRVVITREDAPGEKRLVAYIVARQGFDPTVSNLRDFLKGQLPDYMVPAAFIFLDALPLTLSGKVDRRALPMPGRSSFGQERAFVAPRTQVEEVLTEIWAEALGLERVGICDNFFELGGDSILSIQISTRANQLGLRVTPLQLLKHQTIDALATVVGTAPSVHAEQDLVTGPSPLTPIQHWFFEHKFPEPDRWNQAILLEAQQSLEPTLLEKVVQHLLVHHDALRLRFVRTESGWQQINAGLDETLPFSQLDLSALSEAEQRSAIESTRTELQASLSLAEGPLLRAVLFHLGAQKEDRLLLVIHALAADPFSWRILLHDLQTGYQQLSLTKAVELQPKTTSFKYWAQRLLQYAQSGALQQELNYWLAGSRTSVPKLPRDYPDGANTVTSTRTVSVSLSVIETQALLHEIHQTYNTQINDVLLVAMAQAFSKWDGAHPFLIEMAGHGREEIVEDVDLSRTVGWLTTRFPVLLDLETAVDPGDTLKAVKEQLREIPNRGIGYGLIRYLGGDTEIAEKLRALPQPEVIFNYLGQFDDVMPESSPFELVQKSRGLALSLMATDGSARGLQGTRRYLLEVNANIAEGRLQMDWRYSENIHRRTTIEQLARDFMEALRSLIAHCQSPQAGGYTPSDFPLANFEQGQLDKIISKISKR